MVQRHKPDAQLWGRDHESGSVGHIDCVQAARSTGFDCERGFGCDGRGSSGFLRTAPHDSDWRAQMDTKSVSISGADRGLGHLVLGIPASDKTARSPRERAALALIFFASAEAALARPKADSQLS